MRYRKLDVNGDMMFGRGQADFYRDVPEAPAQAVKTRLFLRLGEWFLDTSDGTPWNTEILGAHTQNTRDAALRERIEGTTGVSSLDAYSSSYNSDTRSLSVSATITTSYGVSTLYYTNGQTKTSDQLAQEAETATDVIDAVYGQLDFSNPFQSGWL
ncbi:hypothetical protein Xaut_3650 [Xanthobacter versatilis]|uniref:Uncharacterized protein n=1 Tax=Xanthobacter autotrophicus (strain ATCC BAA-1158 / Py2) TaxID=78245 RepID=A7ILI5_XANP2|nr:hypothetical protein Xaut_3650 [Xanthobacter autotrophicus Py2]